MSIDFNKPVKEDNYNTGYLSALRAHVLAAAMWLDTSLAGTVSNPVNGVKRYNATSGLLEYFNGTSWVELPINYIKNTTPTNYGSHLITRSLGGYAGFQFNSGTKLRTLMIANADGASGVYNNTDGAWYWQFDGSGALSVGSVPWAHVSGAPAITGLTADANPTANTVARRDASGYLFAAYFNQGSGNNENPTISQVMVTNGSDGYFRKASLSHLGNNITVPWANVSSRPTDLASFTNGPGYITVSALSPYAALSSSPQFSGPVRGNGGTKGLGAITTTTTTGTPSGGADGDVVLVY